MIKPLVLLTLLAFLLGGCASTSTGTSSAAQVQQAVASACPTLKAGLAGAVELQLGTSKAQADLLQVQSLVTTICATNATIDPTSLTTLINTAIPALAADVAAVPGLDPATEKTIVGGLALAQIILASAFTTPPTTTVTPVPSTTTTVQ